MSTPSSIELTIHGLLTADSTIDSLVSGGVHPDKAPEQAALPYLVFHRQDIDPFETLSGTLSLTRSAIVIDIWADTYREIHQLFHAIRSVLQPYHGGNVQGIFWKDSQTIQDSEHYHGQMTFFCYAEDDEFIDITGEDELLAVDDTDLLII